MKVIVSLSGGLDSTVLLWYLQKVGHEVRCLSVDYGQRHEKELAHAGYLATIARCEHKTLHLGKALQGILTGSSQTSEDIPVPEGHYAEESMKQTVVPNRNMLLLSLAGAWAVSTKSDAIAYAAHAGDHAIYPDCRPEFTEAMEDALRLCDWHSVKLIRPFLYPKPMSKADIVKLGAELGVPFKRTWSCYAGKDLHCGKCGTCYERIEAFQLSTNSGESC